MAVTVVDTRQGDGDRARRWRRSRAWAGCRHRTRPGQTGPDGPGTSAVPARRVDGRRSSAARPRRHRASGRSGRRGRPIGGPGQRRAGLVDLGVVAAGPHRSGTGQTHRARTTPPEGGRWRPAPAGTCPWPRTRRWPARALATTAMTVHRQLASLGVDVVDPEGTEPDEVRARHAVTSAIAWTEARPSSRPVHVVEVEDEGELVEHQRRADADDHGGHVDPDVVGTGRHRHDGPEQQQDDPGDRVVHVDAAGALDVVERTAPGADHAGDGPGRQERHHEGDEQEQQRQLARARRCCAPTSRRTSNDLGATDGAPTVRAAARGCRPGTGRRPRSCRRWARRSTRRRRPSPRGWRPAACGSCARPWPW